MCEESKSCEISDEDWVSFKETAEKAQEDDSDTKIETVEDAKDLGDNSVMPEGQPLVELQKSQLALQGSMLTAQKSTNTLLTELIGVMKSIDARLGPIEAKQEVTEQPAPTEEQENVSELSQEADQELAKHMSDIAALNKRLDILMLD